MSFDPLLQIASLAEHLLIGVDRLHLCAHAIQERERRRAAADQDLSPHAHLKRVRNVYRGLDGFTQAVVARVCNHADDLEPIIAVGHGLRERRRALHIGETQLLAHSVAVRPILPRHGLIYNYKAGAACDFLTIP